LVNHNMLKEKSMTRQNVETLYGTLHKNLMVTIMFVVNLSQVIDITFTPKLDTPSLEVNQININTLSTILYKHTNKYN
jgi:hypothetical protein